MVKEGRRHRVRTQRVPKFLWERCICTTWPKPVQGLRALACGLRLEDLGVGVDRGASRKDDGNRWKGVRLPVDMVSASGFRVVLRGSLAC